VPVVVTIHDTKPFENKSDFWKEEFYTKTLQPAALRKAQRIITPSLYSKKSIVEKLKISDSKIEVIYQGMGKQFKVIEDKQALGRIGLKLKLDGKFILTVGGETPSKNISRLIEAYALLKKKNVSHQLVITGIRNQDVLAKHLAEAQKLGIEAQVKIFGYVDEEDLIGLYNLTDLFIYPSLFEGFGFPPLEAMACGAVVAASNATSIPEVVGDAGLLFDGKNIQNMADSMHQLIKDETLRKDLTRKGFERVKQFEWRLAAQKTLAIYKEIAS
jgi:glycosyltransferase involved in cell wall biosynthesis